MADVDVMEQRIAGIEERRTLGEAQTDLEDVVGRPEQPAPRKAVGGLNAEAVKRAVLEIEQLETERKVLADDIKEILARAKVSGLDPKVIRELIRERKKEDVAEQLSLLDLYRACMDA